MATDASIGVPAPPRPRTPADRATHTPDRSRPNSLARSLWSSLPRELASKFRPHAGRMAMDMLQEIQRSVPEYGQPLNGATVEFVTEGIRQAILHCMDNIAESAQRDDEWAAMFRQFGRLEFRAGRNLDSLQASYRVGGRVAWRHVSGWGQAQGLSADLLCVGADAIFAYVDEISALSVEGYTAAQTQAAGTKERRRRALLDLILAQPPASRQSVLNLAESAEWPLPEEVAVIALEQRPDQHRLPSPAFHDDVLVDLEGTEPCLVVSNPEQQIGHLSRELQGWRAVIGPVVRLSEAAASLRWARRTLDLVQRKVIDENPITWCRDHLSTLWLLADEFLVAELIKTTLSPLADLTIKQRARLTETLLAWLEARGSAPEIANLLKVHPQTVRYRMRQVEKLFGDRLTDPQQRLDLEISLRAQRLLAPEPAA